MAIIKKDKQSQKSVEQEEVGEALRQIKLVVDNSYDAIIGEKLDGTITSWNGGAERMFGYSAQEMIGKSVLSFIPDEQKDKTLEVFKKIKAGEIVTDYDSVRLKKDGAKIDVAFSSSPIKLEDGTIIGVSVVERDITARKWYEARIEHMAKLYSALSRCNKAVVYSKNEIELFQEICTAAVKFGGLTMAWVGLLDEKSKKIKPIASFGIGKEYLNDINISVDVNDQFGRGPTGTSVRENHPVWCQDLERDPMMAPWRNDRTKDFGWRASAALPLIKDGIPIGSFTLYSGIINEFDEDEQKLLIEMASDISFALNNFTNKAKLEKSEESLRQTQLVVDNSYDAIIGETLDGIITNWNGGAERMFGYSVQEMIGKSVSLLLPDEMKEEMPVLLAKVKAGEFIADYDSVMLRKDGSKIEVAFSGSPIKTEDGAIIGVSVVERDITVRKKGERHIKELNEIRSKFITIISHQLRTPLTAVNWNLETLLSGKFGKFEDIQHKFLQITYNASVEITNRINNLLMAIDVEEGRIRYITEEVDINSLCVGVVNEALKRCELKSLSCAYMPPSGESPLIDGDGEKIRMVISAFIENAIGYTKEGGKITAALQSKNGVVRFEVVDTGVGIPHAEQSSIFTRFFRASNASTMQPDAFGLGLFLSKYFIEQHNGKIGFESKEGVGSKFWFEIPIKNKVESKK